MPFLGMSRTELYNNIITADYADLPKSFSPELKDLIAQMLKKDPKERITAKNALEHPWFNNALSKEQ